MKRTIMFNKQNLVAVSAAILSLGVVRGGLSVRADASAEMVEKINKAFEQVKAANDERLAGVEAKFEDVVTKDKLEKVQAHLTDLTAEYEKHLAKVAAAELGSGDKDASKLSEEDREYASTFNSWFRNGDGESEVKAANRGGRIHAALSVGSDPDGGFTAPVEWDRTITDKLVEIGQMRRHASKQNVTGQGFKKLYNLRGASGGWAGETDPRLETDTSKLSEYSFSFGEIYANPSLTQRVLEDPEIDLAAWHAGEVETVFTDLESVAFMSGDGVNKPKGFLNFDAASESALPAQEQHPLGPILETTSGVAGVAGGIDQDSLISLAYELPDERSAGAAYYASRPTIAAIRLLKDADGRHFWQPPYQAGQPAVVNGMPIYELDGMGDVTVDGDIAVAFGNMAMTYRIFDRIGISVLRDPYTNKPYVSFYTRKRVGGGLWQPEYMRYMRVGA